MNETADGKPAVSIQLQKGVSRLAGRKKIRKFLFRLIGVVIAAALLVLLAASLIIARPQEEEKAFADQPSAESRPPVSVDRETELVQLMSDFPAPLMSFMSGSGMVFVTANSTDAAVNGGFARVATLYWQTAGGEPITLQSIWPADALSLLADGYHFMPYVGPTLFGSNSVRMENDTSVRLHTATDKALYVVLLPRSLSGQAGEICRSLQLYTVKEDKQ